MNFGIFAAAASPFPSSAGGPLTNYYFAPRFPSQKGLLSPAVPTRLILPLSRDGLTGELILGSSRRMRIGAGGILEILRRPGKKWDFASHKIFVLATVPGDFF